MNKQKKNVGGGWCKYFITEQNIVYIPGVKP